LFSLFLLLCVIPALSCGQSAETLSQARKLYIGSFGQDRNAAKVRGQLIRRLEKSHELQVVQRLNEADAFVKGTAQIWTAGHISLSPHSEASATVFEGFLSVEVIGKNNQTLWSYLVTPSKFSVDIKSDLAAQLAKRLLGDMKQSNQQGPPPSGALSDIRAVLKGAGGTFPAPLYQKWFELFEEIHPGVRVQYDAVG
jgi:hypothetical protein